MWLAALTLGTLTLDAAESPRVEIVDHGAAIVVHRLGAASDPSRLAVYTDAAARTDHPAVLGAATLEGPSDARRARFTPRFPFVPDQGYVAVWRGDADDEAIELPFLLPRPSLARTTTVLAVHPRVELVPENLLKLYVRFSAPMTRGRAARHLRLVDETLDQALEEPWVAPEHELWNGDSTRLTLFFDPGRIKRGVRPHEEMGPPLTEGHVYRLVVDADFRDARGAPLAEAHIHRFRAGPPDRQAPRLEDWALEAPTDADAPVRLRLPEPFDHALLHRLLLVIDADEHAVDGEITLGEGDAVWTFQPASPWRAGDYAIVVGAALEDLAGNSLLRAFETELDAAELAERERRLPFRVEP